MLAGAPKFLDAARFDVIAKASTTSGPANAPQVDIDDLRLMLRALLLERFKLATHMEDRPVPAYTLTSVKPGSSRKLILRIVQDARRVLEQTAKTRGSRIQCFRGCLPATT